MKVFVDSDVIISSLISDTGAAYLLLHKMDGIECHVSDLSIRELDVVVARMNLDSHKLVNLIKTRLSVVELEPSLEQIKKELDSYVFDGNDAHIVAGAHNSGATFLISYNIRDFDAAKLKQGFNILVFTPGAFLQYLRSQS